MYYCARAFALLLIKYYNHDVIIININKKEP